MSPDPEENPDPVSRRQFLIFLGWALFWGTVGASGVAGIRSFLVPLLSERDAVFKAGKPTTFKINEVSNRFFSSHRTWLVRTPEGFYALSAICTHLGCRTDWVPATHEFACYCHNSHFKKTGHPVSGPAPRSLERYHISLSADGQIVVDKRKKFLYEKGEWQDSGAFLKFR